MELRGNRGVSAKLGEYRRGMEIDMDIELFDIFIIVYFIFVILRFCYYLFYVCYFKV